MRNPLDNDISTQSAVNRWRLILGGFSKNRLNFSGQGEELNSLYDMEGLLDFLYNYGRGDDVRTDDRTGGLGDSQLQACEWITRVRKLFPKRTAEVLEKQAVEDFHMTELITDKKVLEQMKPDMNLLKSILQLKHLMKGDVVMTARLIAKKVVEELKEKIEEDIKKSFTGAIDRSTSSPVRSARNIDIKKTIRKNLKNYDRESETLILQDIYFSGRMKKYNKKHIIIAVDESGSMLSSVIHSAVMAQIFSALPFAEVSLVIFDTNVVDLSKYADDPVSILMSVQLGGGTDIGKALSYCEQLISNPSDSCVIVVTDLFEGADTRVLLNTSKNLITSGAKLNFLTALDEEANPCYDKHLAQKLVNIGAFAGALTPGELGAYVRRIIG